MKRSNRLSWVVTFLLITAVTRTLSAEAYGKPKDGNDLSFYVKAQSSEPYALTQRKAPTNIILCIGDGMGLAQVATARLETLGKEGRLHMERMPVCGLVRTEPAVGWVTDSAAAATALACGVETRNGMIGMAPDGQAYQSLLEAAQNRGMRTGLVATSAITHATPACFAAHVQGRRAEALIAEQLLAHRVNVLLGGGRGFFVPQSVPGSDRDDDQDLVRKAKEAGYYYAETATDLAGAGGPYVLGLFQMKALTTLEPEPSITQLTTSAIHLLSKKTKAWLNKDRGFFLMIEGSEIDWTCHAHDVPNTVRQILLFDQAVKAAMDFAIRNQDTLVVVTADHETGGLTILANTQTKSPTFAWSTKGHTASPVPLYAYGPGALTFSGVLDNTDVPKKVAGLLGIKGFPKPVK